MSGNDDDEVGKSFNVSKGSTIDTEFSKRTAEIAHQFASINPRLQEAIDRSAILGTQNSIREAMANSGVSATLEATKSFTDNFDAVQEHSSAADELRKLAEQARSTVDQLSVGRVYDRLDTLSDAAVGNTALANAIRGIEKQQHTLDAMTAPEPVLPHIDRLEIPENPIIETNRKLDRIEKQFSQVSTIAHDSAQVATGLQAYAADFLLKFEKAAEETNQSGSKAIKVGWLALAIAVVVGAGQIFAPMFLKDQEAEALKQTVIDLKSEILALREEQNSANERMIDALENSDRATAEILRETLSAISTQKAILPNKE